MEKLKQNWALITIIILLFSVLIIFLIGYININPSNMYVYDLSFNGEMANVELATNNHLSKVIFILMLAVILGGLFVLLVLLINFNTKASLLNMQTIIDNQRKINDEAINMYINDNRSFIVAYKDINDDKIKINEKRMLVDLINNNYDIYINHVKTRISNDIILYDVYVEGKILLQQVSYKEMKNKDELLPILGNNKEENVK